jgi:membrane protein DedA with SNARE-associated domain
MPDFNNFSLITGWIASHGYWVVFLLFCIEGPISTAATGFLSAAGFFNAEIILVLSVLGDLVPDSIYYGIGYMSRFRFIENLGEHIGLTKYRILKLEIGFKKHFSKTMLALKLTPVVSTLGFMTVGYLRISFRKFIGWCSVVTIPKSLIFFSIGYFFGQLYNIDTYLHYATIFSPLVILFALALFLGYNKIMAVLAGKLNDKGKKES